MSEIDRLIGKFEQFMASTGEDLQDIKTCLEDLKAFKWKVVGGSAVVAFLASMIARVVG